jgi:CHASE2 domain-containing sensor protein
MATIQDRKQTKERLRHATWAGLIALALSLLGFLASLDQVTWILQARFAGFQASGDIVFVGSEQDLTDPDFPQRREQLARALLNLRNAGANSVYVDMAFDQASQSVSDQALNEALLAFDGNAYLIRNLTSGLGNQGFALERSVDAIGKGVGQLGGDRGFTYMGS